MLWHVNIWLKRIVDTENKHLDIVLLHEEELLPNGRYQTLKDVSHRGVYSCVIK